MTPGTASQHNIAVTVAGLPDKQIEGAGDTGIGDDLRDGPAGLAGRAQPVDVGL